MVKKYDYCIFFRRYVFHAMCQVCDSVTVAMEMTSLPDLDGCEQEMPINNSKKKTKLENERQVLLLKEMDNVSKNDFCSKDSFHKGLAQKYLDWIQKSCRS